MKIDFALPNKKRVRLTSLDYRQGVTAVGAALAGGLAALPRRYGAVVENILVRSALKIQLHNSETVISVEVYKQLAVTLLIDTSIAPIEQKRTDHHDSCSKSSC